MQRKSWLTKFFIFNSLKESLVMNIKEDKTTVPMKAMPVVFFEDYDDLTIVNIIEEELKKRNYKSAREAINFLERRRHSKKKG